MKHIFWNLLLITSTGFGYFGQETQKTPSDFLRQALAEIQEQLQLSQVQKDKVLPILADGLKAQRHVLKRYGIDPETSKSGSKLGLRKARKLGRELKQLRSKTLEDLEPHLSKEQFEAYKKIQEARQQAVRERIREGRDS